MQTQQVGWLRRAGALRSTAPLPTPLHRGWRSLRTGSDPPEGPSFLRTVRAEAELGGW